MEPGAEWAQIFRETWRLQRDYLYDVDMNGGFVWIRRKDGFTPNTAHSERRVPIGRGLLETLQALPKSGHLVFPGRGAVVRTSVAKALASAIRAAKVMRNGKPMKLKGGNGDDSFFGGLERDNASGGADDDFLSGGDGKDKLFGDAGKNVDAILAGLPGA